MASATSRTRWARRHTTASRCSPACRSRFSTARCPGLPADDAQSRYIEIEADGITIIGIYLPNGNSGGEAGFAYKLAWLDRLAERAEALLEADTPFVIAGDFNVCPTDEDFAPGALSPPTPWCARKAAPGSAACCGMA